MPSDAEVERFTTSLLALGPAKIDELAQAAGVGPEAVVRIVR
jgi:hypothetical protein